MYSFKFVLKARKLPNGVYAIIYKYLINQGLARLLTFSVFSLGYEYKLRKVKQSLADDYQRCELYSLYVGLWAQTTQLADAHWYPG